MSKLTSTLYNIARKAGKVGSVLNDVENIASGKPEKVVKKALNREIHKAINKMIK